ncbi:ankyrin repeat domain-containing protein [Paenibacillus mesophilus]|uniref:ankyrin repeat domain-containing protein n=1 Tax=Paenibacillus mesophilus TaxID=2582849 RepID=UPI0013051339|nr:ankyrin repeat domain-containing protein [Paenibacillus mesophilus]
MTHNRNERSGVNGNKPIVPEALRIEHGDDAWNTFAGSISGDSAALEQLLSQNPGLANCSWGYYTPLHFAVRFGHSDAVKLLLRYGADATEKTLGWQDTPLTKAQDREYVAIARMLEEHLSRNYQTSPAGSGIAELIKAGLPDKALNELDNRPDLIHSGDERGNTPLHWAVLTRQIGLIDELLRRGADFQAARADGATPHQLAVEGDYWFRANRDLNPQALRNQWFLQGYVVARSGVYDIWTAAAVGDSEHMAALLREDPSLVNRKNSVDKRPLSYAARQGHTAAVKLLLAHGADPNMDERGAARGSALWGAVMDGHMECVKLLLEQGADPNGSVEAGASPLGLAIKKGYHEMVSLLYSYGASMTLDLACWTGRIDLAAEIIKGSPSSVNEGGDYGPLCMAAGYGHMDIVKMLIRSGADLNAPWYANNYIGYAVDTGMDMVSYLLDSGADPNNANWLGVTYLHKAAWLGNVPFARLLLKYGADLHAVEAEYDSTPLGWAAKFGQTEMVRFLLEHGADPSLPSDTAWAHPVAWAKRKGHEEIVALLARKA